MQRASDCIDNIVNSGWKITPEIWAQQDDYGKSFMMLELAGQRTFNYYQERLGALGFSGLGKVADIGSGLGQWSIAMASLNEEVQGIDINDGRLKTALQLVESHDVSNVHFQKSNAEKTPFEDESFDGVFCYGVFMFTDMPAAMAEFRRILKPGARLYLNANTWGWYAHMLIDLGIRAGNYNMVKSAVRMVLGYFQGKNQGVMVTENSIHKLLSEHGFNVLALGAEGKSPLHLNPGKVPPDASYPSSFYGMLSILEAVAVKK